MYKFIIIILISNKIIFKSVFSYIFRYLNKTVLSTYLWLSELIGVT